MIQEVLTIQFTYLRDTPDPRIRSMTVAERKNPGLLNASSSCRTHNQGVLLSPQEKQVFQHFLL